MKIFTDFLIRNIFLLSCLGHLHLRCRSLRFLLTIAKQSAKRAGVGNSIRFFSADARTITKPDRRGTIVCNPPYGERLMTVSEVEKLYREMGKHFSSFDKWQIYVLTSAENFQNLYGRRADKVRKLYNGMIPCNLYQFFKNK